MKRTLRHGVLVMSTCRRFFVLDDLNHAGFPGLDTEIEFGDGF